MFFVLNLVFGVRRKRSDKILALEEQKVSLFQKKLDKDADMNDANLFFLRGVLPEIKKARRPFALKRKIMQCIDDFLAEEELVQPEVI